VREREQREREGETERERQREEGKESALFLYSHSIEGGRAVHEGKGRM